MRVVIITESFPPDVNGVSHSVVRVAEQLVRRGHQPMVVAPRPAGGRCRDEYDYPVARVRSVPLPGYPGFRLGLPSGVRAAVAEFAPDVVHLASPVVLGAWGARVASSLGVPAVAVYQTDLPAYARAYRMGGVGEAIAWRWLRRVHARCERTLAPSTSTATGLVAHGMRDVWLWGRGVDCDRFHPSRRSAQWRASVAPEGTVLVGYVGRLATEKRVELLAGVADLDNVQLVIVGGGPAEATLRAALPSAVFLGPRYGAELASIYASLDVFVHSGPFETFGQTLQEAAASAVPVVAPASGGPLDLVADGETGFLVTPGSGAALATAVSRLAGDQGLRARFGSAGRERVLGRSWSALTRELLGHYAAAVADPAEQRQKQPEAAA
jgi:phosphatidylinositol alpha 1,6-mannosyltransferase